MDLKYLNVTQANCLVPNRLGLSIPIAESDHLSSGKSYERESIHHTILATNLLPFCAKVLHILRTAWYEKSFTRNWFTVDILNAL